MHRLLARQLKKYFKEIPENLRQLVDDIDASYQNFDEDYKRLERILELSSKELFKANQALNSEKVKIEGELAESYKQLSISEQRWNYALSGSNDGVWDWDLDANEVYFSPSWKSMLGYKPEEIENKFDEWEKRVHPEDVARAHEEIEKHTKGLTPQYVVEHRMRCKDGTYKWILSRGKIIESPDENGKNRRRFIGTHTDITQRKEAETQARTAEWIIKNSPSVLIRWAPNRNLNIEYISENISRYGYDALTLTHGKTSFIKMVHPDDVMRVTDEVIKAVRGKKNTLDIDFRLIDKWGAVHWMNSQNTIEWASEDEVKHFQGILTDITEKVLADEKLKESENRFRSLVQNSTDITTILSSDAVTVYESPSFYRTFGYEEDEALGKNIFEFIHPEDLLRTQEEFLKGLERGGISDPIEFRFRHKNGRWVYVESVGNNLLHVPGIEGIVLNSRDISERKEAEAENLRLKEFYETILNKIPTDVAVFDHKHRYVFVNESAIRDASKRAFVIGKDDYEYFKHYGLDIKLADNRRAIFDQVFKEKKQIEFEEPIDRPTGRIWMLRRMFPVLDENGEVRNMIGFGLDITQRKMAEEKIKKSQAELEEAQHIARIGSWDVNLANNDITWSKEMYNIHELEDDFVIKEENSLQFYTEDTRQSVVDAFVQSVETNEPFEIEGVILTAKGNKLDVKTKGVPISLPEGKFMKGIFQDITKEKEAERQLKEYTNDLEKINKELDQFAYIVSHDLKAPLRAISNLSVWIEEDIDDKMEEETRYQFKLLRGRVHRLEDLINGILDYSRAGRVKVNPGLVNVDNLLQEVIGMLAPPGNFKITVADKMPVIFTEKIAIQQVFSNLISNAIKYDANPEPEIRITCVSEAKFYKFGVEDNGDGIAPAYHEKIFVIFQTLEARDKIESTGVGLAIVKKIVEDKGGKIWVESEKGQGARFYFTWPKY